MSSETKSMVKGPTCILGIGTAQPRTHVELGEEQKATTHDFIRWQKLHCDTKVKALLAEPESPQNGEQGESEGHNGNAVAAGSSSASSSSSNGVTPTKAPKSAATNGHTPAKANGHSNGNGNANGMTDDDKAINTKKRKKMASNLETTFHWTKKLCLSSGIDQRYFCAPTIVNPEENRTLLDQQPSINERASFWEKFAPVMAEQSAKKALDHAGVKPEDVTHVVSHSCTGWKAPGISFHLFDALGLRPTTRRVEVNFMGCFGASTALYVAKSIVDASPADEPACVLISCVELCTLHLATENISLQRLIGNILFADGAAAAVVGRPTKQSPQAWKMCKLRSEIIPNSRNAMVWKQGSHAYDMLLDRSIPQHFETFLAARSADLVKDSGLRGKPSEVDYCIHPGGRAILESFEKAFDKYGVNKSSLDASYNVLKRYGNMSSPTMLYVLRELLDKQKVAQEESKDTPKDEIFFMVFGPGLTVEFGGLQRVQV